ncbi:ABC transporter substrate-binding protein [Vibrio astriarenae]|uniref:ABC transporter substrate-binding protein n=1 Tax=Vibrio astriarenae TaxID=1481923 RepID=A0A7Z2T6V6_9VIBR|nr:ABC transporter substrate-binding protein [Vibrio astriarenae]QIA65355.1 ABC transporter substrate-binding protein [Vibrio astriarenae]
MTPPFRLLVITLRALCLILICSSTLAAKEQKDDLGKAVTVLSPEITPRIASVSSFGAELSLALGFSPVAVSQPVEAFPSYLSNLKEVRSLGSRSNTNFTELYNAQPNLVVGLRRMVEPYYQRFNEIAPVLAFDLVTLENSIRAVEITSQSIGKSSEGKQLNACFQETIETMQRLIGKQEMTGIFLTSAGVTPRAYYSHFMTVALMEKLNINNANGASPYQASMPFSGQVGMEWLVKLDPDIIFMYENSKPQYTQSRVWQSLKAVQNSRVYTVDMTWREPEGPYSRLWVAMDIANKAYPELFAPPSVQKVNDALCQ